MYDSGDDIDDSYDIFRGVYSGDITGFSTAINS